MNIEIKTYSKIQFKEFLNNRQITDMNVDMF